MVSLIPKNNFYYNNKIKGSQKYILIESLLSDIEITKKILMC